MAAVTYSVREQKGTGYGPVIGHLAARDVPSDHGTLLEVKVKLMRIVSVRDLDATVIVEPFADPG